ncbi:MAG: hypothetical protein LIO90_03765 [Bacteroidales bacterium]|nr:hypothetical protein [Bacteroidales bacterium]
MKKELYLLFGALTLASCSSDDIVKPVEPNPALTETPMSFSVRTENQGRADAGLQTVHSNFGVYGFKDTLLSGEIFPNKV